MDVAIIKTERFVLNKRESATTSNKHHLLFFGSEVPENYKLL